MARVDRGLRKAIRSGDPQVFDDLWDEYAHRVMGLLLRLTGSRADAEDLAQDTFVAAHAGRRTYRACGSPLSWLLGIAVRRWRDGRRRASVPSSDIDTDGIAGPADDADLSIGLGQELLRLPPEQREAFVLVASQGLTYREASEATGVAEGTLKWRVHEATRRLREALSDEGMGADDVRAELGTEADAAGCE